jgi:uncharacterized protein YdeI (BOF family)
MPLGFCGFPVSITISTTRLGESKPVSYRIEQFRQLGLYQEASESEECSFEGGRVVQVPPRIATLLEIVGGNSLGGDKSKQDSSVITMMLQGGMSPADTYATFKTSAKGQDAISRKNGHSEDYMRRTIERALAFVNSNPTKINIDFSNSKSKPTGTGLIVSMGHEVETERVHWVWPGYIPAGKLTLVAGDPGMGKSTLVGDLIARISKGTHLPSGQRSITGTSLIASAEDSPEDTIIPRLIACGANLKRVGIIREVRDAKSADEESRYLCFPRDLTLLRDTLVSTGARILVIDPLNAFVEKGVDTYKDQDIRRILHPLETIAQETGTAIIIVAHLNKKEDASTLYRVGGTIGFVGAARSVLAVSKLPDDTNVLFWLKGNLARRPPSMAYEIKQVRKIKTATNTWKGENVIHSSSIRWLGEVDFNPLSKNQAPTPEARVMEEATEFLRQVLQQSQEVDTEALYAEARAAGIAKSHLNRVKSSLGIVQTRRNGAWFWSWPTE